MTKIYKLMTMLFLLLFVATGTVMASERFEIYEDFDDASHFSENETVPNGWKSEGTYAFARGTGSYFGVSAKSGEYVFGTAASYEYGRTEVVYTPMMKLAGGKPCSIMLSVYAPGGSPATVRNNGFTVKAGTDQSADAQTIEVGTVANAAYASWTDFAFSFTPENDGEYCFSLALNCTIASSGVVAIDDVLIEGTLPTEEEPVVEPNPENYSSALELPYFNTFDNYDNDYDGTSVVPANWKSVGSSPFFTAAITGLDAVTGSYYIVADESADDNRDDRLYTPFFRLKAGTEYTVSYYLYMPGNSGGGVLRSTDLSVTVGSEQDIDFHPVAVQKIEGQSISGFTKQEFKFTPEFTGAYCFAFSLNTTVNYSGQIAIDDFNITAPGLVAKPTANFGIGGIFELWYSNLLTYPGQQVELVNQSLNATEYAWTVTCPDASTMTSEEENPTFEFNQNGTYSIALTVSNSSGSRSTSKSVAVQHISGVYDGSLTTWNPNHDALMERGLLPSFAAYGNEYYDYDFVSGFNRFYKKVAERFEMQDDVVAEIASLNIWLGHYKNRAYTSGYDSDKPFSIVFYGETDSKLDENKVFGRVDSRLVDIFGNSGIGGSAGEPRDVNFTELLGAPVRTQGTFYLSFEFDKDMTIIPDDPNVGRSYFGMNTVEHATGVATLYAKPDSVPSNSNIVADGNWYRIDEIDPTKKALGNYFILWGKTSLASSSVAISNLGDIVFAIRRDGDNLIVSGTTEGEQVAIYNMNGQLVTAAVATDNSTAIPVQYLNKGVYVVKTTSGTAKFVKK